MSLLTGYGQPAFSIWFGLFTWAIGSFIPSPKEHFSGPVNEDK